MKILKKLIAIFSISLLIFSCNSEDDIQINKDDILGTWDLINFDIDGEVSTIVQGLEIGVASFTTIGKDFNAQLTFTENPNTFSTSGSFTAVTTTTVLGQQTSEEGEIDLDNLLNSGNWEINKNELTFINNIENQIVEIVTLNGTTLKLTSTTVDETTTQDTTIKTTTVTNLTLTK